MSIQLPITKKKGFLDHKNVLWLLSSPSALQFLNSMSHPENYKDYTNTNKQPKAHFIKIPFHLVTNSQAHYKKNVLIQDNNGKQRTLLINVNELQINMST